jgi:molybdate transport system substrate-binding protein
MRYLTSVSLSVLLSGSLSVLLSGCRGPAPSQTSTDQTVTLYAATSTVDAVEQVAGLFQEQYSVEVRINTAATSTLVQQITAGAKADVFLSASDQWMDQLDEEGFIARRCNLLGNRLVIVVPSGSDVPMSSPSDLLSGHVKRIAIADPTCVPAGIYAKKALQQLELWEQLRGKMVPGADVRRALTFVETGAAQAGIVYATDAAASNRVRAAYRFPPDPDAPIRYPVGLLKRAEDKSTAKALFEFLQSPQAAKAFTSHGFTVLSSRPEGAGE